MCLSKITFTTRNNTHLTFGMGTIIVPNHLERRDVALGKHVDQDFYVANHTVPHFETIGITQKPGVLGIKFREETQEYIYIQLYIN